MATTARFENAQLADAFTKANRLAPMKGAAFDKAAGFHLTVQPSLSRMTVRSTDMDSTYLQHVPMLKGEGDEVCWRVPSLMVTSMLQALPLGSDNHIEFIDRDDGTIRLRSGKWVAKLNMMRPDDFPLIPEFDTESLAAADDLPSKIEQVTWACDAKTDILAGVYLDGRRIVGCNRAALAVVPCVLPVVHPVIVPLASLGGILKVATEVRLGAVERELRLSLDGETQATSRLIEGEFPPIDRVMRDDWRGFVKVGKTRLVEAMNRMMNLIRSERMPSMEVTIDGSGLVGMLTFDMEVEQVGRMQDAVDVDAEGFDDVINFHVRPQMLMNAVDHSKSDNVTIYFGNTDPLKEPKSTIAVKDDRGYECHLTRLLK